VTTKKLDFQLEVELLKTTKNKKGPLIGGPLGCCLLDEQGLFANAATAVAGLTLNVVNRMRTTNIFLALRAPCSALLGHLEPFVVCG